ncbi:ABC-type sugar transport system, ATPase component protein [Herbaspirillum rubrisubalbicans M1]|uniref:ABC transporter ATP-binding protein n=1 Tax=Herbaspirillum rubrisubalbicans TaxID=80842 RepID=UPI00073A1E21|nr:sn-glycerol-3-phosphate ABC transporter ATP-binding protein UgpC [Herbaspirillum rubrisubalbicans]ALU90574.1 ABC-type sugar transport system, ATPase component protein [Herbaspirillum rubrisubalbicans M1]
MADILCQGLSKHYAGGPPVLHPLDLKIDDGQFVVLLGPSGCGKSTMLRMIAGLEEISGGTLSIGGKVVNDLPARERNVAMVFQNYALYPHMNVYDNIAFGLRRLKRPAAEIDRRVREVAAMLNLETLLERKPRAMSGGQQQRAAIARAIIKTPSVFLFDEPLSNLDAKLRAQLRGDIKRLHQRLRTTTVYVTHDQLEAMTLADRVVLMQGGHIVQAGSPAELYRYPRTLFAAGFIGTPAMNFLSGVVERHGQQVAVRCTSQQSQRSQQSQCWVLHDERFSRLPDGLAVKLAVRPDYVRLAREQDDNRSLTSDVSVELVEILGADALLTCRHGDETLTALLPAQRLPQAGAALRLAFDEQELHVFDVKSGENLSLPAGALAPSWPDDDPHSKETKHEPGSGAGPYPPGRIVQGLGA